MRTPIRLGCIEENGKDHPDWGPSGFRYQADEWYEDSGSFACNH